MKKTILKSGVTILFLSGLMTVIAQERPSTLRPNDRFNGTTHVRMRNAQGQSQLVEISVNIQNWSLTGGQKLEALPLQASGLLVAQLRAGELTTVIGGEKQQRQEDEFWTVRPGVLLGVETGNDSASLQTIVINER